jgi:hypothetical protein
MFRQPAMATGFPARLRPILLTLAALSQPHQGAHQCGICREYRQKYRLFPASFLALIKYTRQYLQAPGQRRSRRRLAAADSPLQLSKPLFYDR